MIDELEAIGRSHERLAPLDPFLIPTYIGVRDPAVVFDVELLRGLNPPRFVRSFHSPELSRIFFTPLAETDRNSGDRSTPIHGQESQKLKIVRIDKLAFDSHRVASA